MGDCTTYKLSGDVFFIAILALSRLKILNHALLLSTYMQAYTQTIACVVPYSTIQNLYNILTPNKFRGIVKIFLAVLSCF